MEWCYNLLMDFLKIKNIFLLIFLLFMLPNYVNAISLVSFGGKVLTSIPCTCSAPGTMMVTIGPPKGGTYLYIPFTSRPFPFYYPSVGRWILGNVSAAPTACMMIASPCTSSGFYRTITIFGTSLR